MSNPYIQQAPVPQAPQQPYPPQQYPPQGYVAPGYPYQPPQQYAPPAQPYPQVFQQVPPPQPEQALGAAGSLDGFQSQRTVGGAPGITWKDHEPPYTVKGTQIRDLKNSDVTQDRAPANQGGALKTYKDGSPMFVLSVPLYVPISQEHPDGEATLYVRGGLKDALDAACNGVFPKGGDEWEITLTERKKVAWAAIPKNMFSVKINRATPAETPAPQAAPVQAAPVQAAPVQAAPVQAAPVQAAPVQAGIDKAFIESLSPEQQALLKSIGG